MVLYIQFTVTSHIDIDYENSCNHKHKTVCKKAGKKITTTENFWILVIPDQIKPESRTSSLVPYSCRQAGILQQCKVKLQRRGLILQIHHLSHHVFASDIFWKSTLSQDMKYSRNSIWNLRAYSFYFCNKDMESESLISHYHIVH